MIMVVVALLTGCRSKDPSPNPVQGNCEPVVLTQDLDQLQSDWFVIDSAYVQDNCLKIQVAYGGGGGGEVFFELHRSNQLFQSLPQQLPIRLTLVDRDFGKAMIYKEISFDLTEIAQVTGKPVLLKLQDYELPIRYE